MIVSGTIYPRASCEPADPSDTVTDRLNGLLSTGGPGYILSLCQNQNYLITAPIEFVAPGQEIRTEGLPTDDSRAMLTVSGPISGDPDGDNHTNAVNGQCPECDGVKLRHVQVWPVLCVRSSLLYVCRLTVRATEGLLLVVVPILKWVAIRQGNSSNMSVHSILGLGRACT